MFIYVLFTLQTNNLDPTIQEMNKSLITFLQNKLGDKVKKGSQAYKDIFKTSEISLKDSKNLSIEFQVPEDYSDDFLGLGKVFDKVLSKNKQFAKKKKGELQIEDKGGQKMLDYKAVVVESETPDTKKFDKDVKTEG